MAMINKNLEFSTVEEGMIKLKESVSLRDKMCGAMYYNILNDDCCEIANKLKSLGADRQSVSNVLGEGTHY